MKPFNDILILTASHLCRNPRVVKEATALGSAGYNVEILNVATTPRFEKMDSDLARPLPFRKTSIDFTGSSPAQRFPRFAARSRTWLARKALRYLRHESLSALGPVQPLLNAALRTQANLTILHTELPLCLARELIARGRRVAVDFEDWYSRDLLENDRLHRPLRLLRRAESFALDNAVYCTAPSESMASSFASAYGGRPPRVLRNVFPLQADPFPSKSNSTPPVFVWFSQTIGPGRGLEPFVRSWCATRRASSLLLIGDDPSGYTSVLKGIAGPERSERIQTVPFVPAAELPSHLARCDIGLALEATQPPSRDLTITNKLFQYLNAGLAVIATNTTGQREALNAATGCGRLIDFGNTTACTALIDDVLSDDSQRRRMQHAARNAAEKRFCWEHEQTDLLHLVRSCLSA